MKWLLDFIRRLFGYKPPLPPIPEIFDPLKNGYTRKVLYDFVNSIFHWGELTHEYPGGQIQKGICINTQDCVEQKANGLHLIAKQGIMPGTNHVGMINTHKSAEWKYGFFEITAKVPPKGFKYFFAIWLYNKRGWQPEIDIVEFMAAESNEATFTHHWVIQDGSDRSEGSVWKPQIDLSTDFHRYAVEWTPSKLSWFVDGVLLYSTNYMIPDVPLFLLCNMQSGSALPGGDAFTHVYKPDEVPMSAVIRKIEIYQK